MWFLIVGYSFLTVTVASGSCAAPRMNANGLGSDGPTSLAFTSKSRQSRSCRRQDWSKGETSSRLRYPQLSDGGPSATSTAAAMA